MSELLAQPFCAQGSFVKASTNAEGDWILSGPINDDGVDYDNQVLPDDTVWKGLEMFDKLGRQVDFGHRYAKTGEPKWLIGRGIPFKGPDGRPWLATTLSKTKEIAKQVWEHMQDPNARMGYSVDGLLKALDKKDNRVMKDVEIHRITIDPSPKGFGQFLQVGIPTGSMLAIAKSVALELATEGPLGPLWKSPDDYVDYFEPAVKGVSDAILARLEAIEKALETGAGIVTAGVTGGAALRGQNLQSSTRVEQKTCKKCGAKNKKSRKACRSCGIEFCGDPLVKALAAAGIAQADKVARQVRVIARK